MTKQKDALVRKIEKQEFKRNLAFYIAVNTVLLLVWLLSGMGYFFPAWSLLGWGLLLLIQAISFQLDFQHIFEDKAQSQALSSNIEPSEESSIKEDQEMDFDFPKRK